MSWWIAITAFIAAALAYGYWNHTKESRHLAKLLARLAEKYQGKAKKANLLALPQLRFDMNGRRFLVTAMATSGHVVAGSSGYSGPFTFVDLSLPFDPGQKVRVERSDSNLTSSASRLIAAVMPCKRPATGHMEFDEAFRIEWSDQEFATRLLDVRVRQKLLDSRLPHLDARVDGETISVHIDGIAKSDADFEELIDIAVLLADHCPPNL
jgi:hypothetical protein